MSPDDLILEIHDLSRGGSGLAREGSGRVIFVPYTMPGDRVRVRLTEQDKRFAHAELVEVLTPSPDRVRAPCPVFGRCGGCQWQHVPYPIQWKTKLSGVRQALERVGIKLPSGGAAAEGGVEIAEIPAELVWEYRNRIQLRGERGSLGYFAAKSRESVSIDRCAIARPEINAALPRLREEAMGMSHPYKVEVEVLGDGSVRTVWNARTASEGFRQVHDEQNTRLQAWVGAAITSGRPLLDLYGGSGNLSAGLAARMSRVDCVDTSAPAGRPEDTPANLVFHRAPVLPWLLQRTARGKLEGPVSVILDPPREGLGADFTDIAAALEDIGADEIVAVGCDPDSWARDVSRFVRRGWTLTAAAVLDLFPQTIHVESIGVLRKS